MKTENSRSGRWTKWILIASLGFNVAVIGLAAGLFIKGPPDHVRGPSNDWVNAMSLPEPYREDLRERMKATRDSWKDYRASLQQQRREIADALTAEPFDLTQVQAAFEAERGLASELQDNGTALLLEQIERMSAAERARYADNLMTARQRHGPRKRD